MARPLSKISRDLLWATARVGVDFWGIFERPYSITYPIWKELDRSLRQLCYTRPEIRRAVRRLRARNMVATRTGRRGDLLVLTKYGRERVAQHLIAALPKIKGDRWDGLWRLVAFDIPETHMRRREGFRRALNRLGLVYVQRSLWVSPFPCEREISLLARFFKVESWVRVALTKKLEPDRDLRKQFDLVKDSL